jgi:hypothetical protein
MPEPRLWAVGDIHGCLTAFDAVIAAPASYAPSDRPGRLVDVPDRHWRFLAAVCRDVRWDRIAPP